MKIFPLIRIFVRISFAYRWPVDIVRSFLAEVPTLASRGSSDDARNGDGRNDGKQTGVVIADQ